MIKNYFFFLRFWSNVAYNPTIVDSVSKFLQDAPTFYALDEFPSVKEMRDLLAELHYYVLSLFARLTTNKESPGQYMSVEYHGKLLYDKFIFTIPVLIDLCQLYGRENSKVVKVIIKSVFKLERLYLEDLKKAIPFFLQVSFHVFYTISLHENVSKITLILRQIFSLHFDCFKRL